ncbi:fido domain-containing protein [Lasiosphaeria ovina]|uniref:Fido domain-containing protein n=1 Tax=Lasiosphaeria ovina TaxID=92902 RepID=A0AAE0JVC0_9PEZI|nr:fido domain-containing protein [Lasiosphaeria ovina]
MMSQTLRSAISKGWPAASRDAATSEELFMTIRADNVYREYQKDQDPKKLYEKAANWFGNIQSTIMDEQQQDVIMKEIQESMIRAIFGSNMIERAGLGLDITINLCRQVFAGEEELRVIEERDPEYQNELLKLYHRQPDLRTKPAKYVLRGRHEIIQHAKAYQHLINAFVTLKQDLTEELIKETHKMLTKGVPIIQDDIDDVSPEEYGGVYRTVVVGAGTTNFLVPKYIPEHMKKMCDRLAQELLVAESAKIIDPFSIATKYSMEFVEIHPFQDGNGRMCRMMLNAILCRYVGIIVPIGESGEERSEYMGIKKRASETMEDHGEYATFVLQRGVTRLREMKKKLAGKASTSKATE